VLAVGKTTRSFFFKPHEKAELDIVQELMQRGENFVHISDQKNDCFGPNVIDFADLAKNLECFA